MLLPRFTIRSMLGLTAAAALAALVVAWGLKGTLWAAGVSIAMLALAMAMAVYAVLFLLFFLLAQVWGPPARRVPPLALPTADEGRPGADYST